MQGHRGLLEPSPDLCSTLGRSPVHRRAILEPDVHVFGPPTAQKDHCQGLNHGTQWCNNPIASWVNPPPQQREMNCLFKTCDTVEWTMRSTEFVMAAHPHRFPPAQAALEPVLVVFPEGLLCRFLVTGLDNWSSVTVTLHCGLNRVMVSLKGIKIIYQMMSFPMLSGIEAVGSTAESYWFMLPMLTQSRTSTSTSVHNLQYI